MNLRPRPAAVYLGVSLASLWRLAKTDPDFPRPIKLSPRVTIWPAADLEAYIARKRTGSAAPAPAPAPRQEVSA